MSLWSSLWRSISESANFSGWSGYLRRDSMFSLYLRSKERISFFRVLGSRVSMGWDFDKDWDFSIASRRERSISSAVISPLGQIHILVDMLLY